MKEFGFTQLQSDVRLFVYQKGKYFVLAIIYVDYAIFCDPNKVLVHKLKALFMKKWECHNLGEIKQFLWMNMCWDGHHIYIDQWNYLDKVL